jgi:hypothetical protein
VVFPMPIAAVERDLTRAQRDLISKLRGGAFARQCHLGNHFSAKSWVPIRPFLSCARQFQLIRVATFQQMDIHEDIHMDIAAIYNVSTQRSPFLA